MGIEFDALIQHPEGSWISWPWGYDTAMATVVGWFGPFTSESAAAAVLLHLSVAADEAEMEAQARALLALGPKAVLLKGGHGSGREAVDILVTRDAQPVRLALLRIDTRNTHGTGCTLSAAIAAGLARGDSITDAVASAKRFVHDALNAGRILKIGGGSGPVDHLHTVRGPRKY